MRQTILVALACLVGACSGGKGSTSDSAGGAVATPLASAPTLADSGAASTALPRAVADVGTYGEDLYDQAKSGHWDKARSAMDSLEAAARSLPGNARISSERRELTGLLDTLRTAVAGKQGAAALEESNRVTYLGAKMSIPYRPATPVDIVLLDYYGRELEIWTARKDQAKLRATAEEIRRTWDAVKPEVVSHGGIAAAAKTDALVAKIEAAKSPTEYGKLATPFLDVVDELEKPFTK
jgi:hypothetical protein